MRTYLIAAIVLQVVVGCGDRQAVQETGKAVAPRAQTEVDSKSAEPSNISNGRYDAIISRAKQYIVERNQDAPVCDRIEQPDLESIRRGKITFVATAAGKLDPPMPAIVARITGTCVIESLRKREPIQNLWITMAYDEVFKTFRCVKIGDESLVKAFTEINCKFME